MTWPPTSRGAATRRVDTLVPERLGQGSVGDVVDDDRLGPLGHGADHALAHADVHPGRGLGRAPRGPDRQAPTVVGHQEDGRRLAADHAARPGQQLLEQGVEGKEGQGRVGDRLDRAQGARGVAQALPDPALGHPAKGQDHHHHDPAGPGEQPGQADGARPSTSCPEVRKWNTRNETKAQVHTRASSPSSMCRPRAWRTSLSTAGPGSPGTSSDSGRSRRRS